jgi:hypothetical protein
MTTLVPFTQLERSNASEEDAPTALESSWDRADWQRMWLRTQDLDWRTLALVPGDEQTSTLAVAHLIARLAGDRGESIRVADTRALRLNEVEAFLEEARREANRSTRVIFATKSPSGSLAAVPLALAADCTILCVSPGSTSLAATRITIEEIGRTHFRGSLLVGPSAAPKARR